MKAVSPQCWMRLPPASKSQCFTEFCRLLICCLTSLTPTGDDLLGQASSLLTPIMENILSGIPTLTWPAPNKVMDFFFFFSFYLGPQTVTLSSVRSLWFPRLMPPSSSVSSSDAWMWFPFYSALTFQGTSKTDQISQRVFLKWSKTNLTATLQSHGSIIAAL